MENTKMLDFIGIGVGPFNLGLAALTRPVPELNGLFLDKNTGFDWHPGMMLQDTTLQIPFLADLVTLADPTNELSFLNYLKETGRIYSFYIRENFLLLRKEYNQYCNWAIGKMSNVLFGKEVTHVTYNSEDKFYLVEAKCTSTGQLHIYHTRKLVLGTGTQPVFPASCREVRDKVTHTSAYLYNKARIQQQKKITVVGSGQSAAEVFYDLLSEIDTFSYELNWITRSPRFYPMEYTKLTLEMTSPEYVDYFFGLPGNKRETLNKTQKNLYKGINQDLIAAIFDLLYTKRLNGEVNASLRTNSELVNVQEKDGKFELLFHQHEQGKHYIHETGEVILATGYAYNEPAFVSGINNRINFDAKGRYQAARNYSIDVNQAEIFVQNAELHTHGFVTPDLGMVAYRNSIIINEMLGRTHYQVEKRIAFQQFGVLPEEEVAIEPVTLDHL